MTGRAWYLHCTADDVAEQAILVGDRGRVSIAAKLMDEVVILNEDRGLTTATGIWAGQRVTVTAFGMGAPIAAIVMHELSALGVKKFLRLGTALAIGDTVLGELVIAHGAVRNESTSTTYLPIEYPAVPGYQLTREIERSAALSDLPVRSGVFASYDGFYTEMFDLTPGRFEAREGMARLAANGVVAVDMETSALLVAGRALGVSAASLCLASVDGVTRIRMSHDERIVAEAELLRVGIEALTNTPLPAINLIHEKE